MAACRHQRCRCTVKKDGDYCSEACQDIAQEQPCICGHGECEGVMSPEVNRQAL